MSVKKEIWIDCETSGVDIKKHGLIEVCGDIVIDGVVKDQFDFLMSPGAKDIEDDALSVIGKTREEVLSYPDQEAAYDSFIGILNRHVNRYDKKDKFEWFGYNPRFDMDFIREWFTLNGNKYFGAYFWTPPIDVWMLSVFAQREHRQDFENTKLWNMAKFYGVDVDKFSAHNARSDIDVTKLLYEAVLKALSAKPQ